MIRDNEEKKLLIEESEKYLPDIEDWFVKRKNDFQRVDDTIKILAVEAFRWGFVEGFDTGKRMNKRQKDE